MRLTFIGLYLLLTAGAASAQTNPCTDVPVSQLSVSPRAVYFLSPDHTAAIAGVNKIASYEFRASLQGQSTVAWSTTIARSAVTVAFTHPTDPTQNCYRAALTFQVGTADSAYVGQVVAKPDASLSLNDAISTASNPFVQPAALRALAVVRVTGQ